jgi:signal transduction histidine kinase
MIKIRTKLVATFLAISVFFGLMIIGVYITSRTAADSFNELNDQSVPRINALDQMKFDSLVIYSRAVEFTVEEDQEELQDYLDEINQAKDDFANAYQKYSLAEGEPDSAVLKDWNEFVSNSDELVQLVQSGTASEEAIETGREKLEQSQEKFESTINQILDVEFEHNLALKASVSSMERSLFIVILAALAAAVVFAAGLGLLVSYRISRPLMQLKDSVTELARGNYEARILQVADDDEIRDLATHFEKMKGELREKDKMQNEFIMVASHELRTPIQPILGLADLALKGHMETKDALKKIRNEAMRLRHLADDILDVTRIEGGKMTYKMENVNVKDLLEGVIQSFSPSIAASVSIVMDLTAADLFVKADKERLEQAFSNILGNAIKFTQAGKIKISCAKSEYEKLEIKISDAGTGIPPEILPRLFEKFVTKDIGGNNKHGTGLGLFITRAIVQAHGGQIIAENQKAGGATFTIVLPVSVMLERDVSELAGRR